MTLEPERQLDGAALFERCRAGDPDAVAAAYDRWGDALYGTALRMLRSPAEAEEVVQESFVTLIEKASGLRVKNLGGWLHRVTVNRSLDRIRRRRPTVAVDGAVPLAAASPRHGAGLDLAAAVERLPDGAREIFLLHDVEGLRHREIADELGISEGTSKSQLFRARQMLRGWLAAAPHDRAGSER